MQLPLYPLPVVVLNVILDGAYESVPAVEFPVVVHLPFEYSPEAFHWTVVYAMGSPGHAVDASMTIHKHIELRARILESSVAVAEGMGIRLFRECLLERIHDDWIVIAVIDPVGDYPPVIEIQYSAEVDFLCLAVDGIFELRDICEPFLVRLLCGELPVQDIVLDMLRILACPCAAFGFPFDC